MGRGVTVPTGSSPRNRLVLLAVGAFMCTPLGCDPAVQGEEGGRGRQTPANPS